MYTNLDLIAMQYKIEELELQRLRDLSDRNMQLQLIGLLNKYNDIQSQINFIRKDDDALIGLLSLI